MEIKAFLRALGASWQLMKKNIKLLWAMDLTILATLLLACAIAGGVALLLRTKKEMLVLMLGSELVVKYAGLVLALLPALPVLALLESMQVAKQRTVLAIHDGEYETYSSFLQAVRIAWGEKVFFRRITFNITRIFVVDLPVVGLAILAALVIVFLLLLSKALGVSGEWPVWLAALATTGVVMYSHYYRSRLDFDEVAHFDRMDDTVLDSVRHSFQLTRGQRGFLWIVFGGIVAGGYVAVKKTFGLLVAYSEINGVVLKYAVLGVAFLFLMLTMPFIEWLILGVYRTFQKDQLSD